MATLKINKAAGIFFGSLFGIVAFFHLNESSTPLNNIFDYEASAPKNNTPQADSICKNCNIIMISVDTLSAEHLSCYGYDRDTAPNLCKFGNDNIFFENSFANATWTLPSHVSIFTSLYPEYHNVIGYGDFLPPKIPFLPEILQNNEYQTYFYIPEGDDTLSIDKIYNRGITKIFSDGRDDIKNPLGYLDKGLDYFLSNVKINQKTFTFLHTYYVHTPYLIEGRKKIYTKDNFDNIPLSLKDILDRPFTWDDYQKLLDGLESKSDNTNNIWHLVSPDFYDRLKNAENLKEAEKIFRNEGDKKFWQAYYTQKRYFVDIDRNNNEQVEYLKALYDQKIHEFDEWVGNKLVPFLNDPLIKSNTIVIITSDHGEEFMEHGKIGHSTLYNPNLKTPLLIYIPSITNKMISAQVQSVDLTPTILDAIGISSNNFSFQGQSLINLIQKNTEINRLLTADGYKNVTKTIIKENWKLFLIKDEDGKYIPYELYDMKSDPNESNNVLASHMDIANEIINKNEEYEKAQKKLQNY